MKQNGLIETVRKEKLKKQVSRTMDRDNNIHDGNTIIYEHIIFNFNMFF